MLVRFTLTVFFFVRLLDVVISWTLLENNFAGDVEFKLVFCPRLYFYTLLKPEELSKSGLRNYYMQVLHSE